MTTILTGWETTAGRISNDSTRVHLQEPAYPPALLRVNLQRAEDAAHDLALTRAWWWYLHPSFSPDGRSVIFQLPRSSSEATDWDVWSVPVTGGEPTLVLKNASLPRYFPDGKQMVFLSPSPNGFTGTALSVSSVGDKGARRMLVEANCSMSWPETSPDGSRIAYQDGGSVYVVDVSTGESSQVAVGNDAEWLDGDTLIVAP